MPTVQCPECSHAFAPPLPEQPAEFNRAREHVGIPGLPAKMTLVMGLLSQLKERFAAWGFVTGLTAADLTWTLTVRVPRPELRADDVRAIET